VTELTLSSRDRILALVAGEPGLHLREVHRRVGLSLRAVRYHLDVLGEEKRVTAYRSGRFERWFEAGTFSERERALISALRVRGQRAILACLLRRGPMGFVSLQTALVLSSATLARHLGRLMDSGLVEIGGDRRYQLEDIPATRMYLTDYRLRFPDLLADAAQEIFMDESLRERPLVSEPSGPSEG
jgi:predicted transcriptional regulator